MRSARTKYCDYAEFDYGVALMNDCKYGHDVHDGVILRMYEAYNRRTKTRVQMPGGVERVFLCDCMENELEELPVSDNGVELNIVPYEIVTLKVCP